MEKSATRAIIFGASGLTGSFVLHHALQNEKYNEVICFVRRAMDPGSPKQKNIITNFNDLHNYKDLFADADIFCCLGTTMKNVGGDRSAYYEADVARPLSIGKLASDAGAACLCVQSSMGANSGSFLFYNKIKGELEDKLKALPLRALYIFRPSLLTGPRKEKRTGELIGKYAMRVFDPLLIGPMKNMRSIPAEKVAKAMLHAAASGLRGNHLYLSGTIHRMADGY